MQHVSTGADQAKNFLVVDSKTDNASIEAAFESFTTERKDIGIVLINQHVSRDEPILYEHSSFLTSCTDCGPDKTSYRHLYGSIPYSPRDSQQGSPI